MKKLLIALGFLACSTSASANCGDFCAVHATCQLSLSSPCQICDQNQCRAPALCVNGVQVCPRE